MGTTRFQPSWWNEEQHGGAWGRVKEAMRRDWEQTKSDFTPGAPDMHQDVGDTVKQAAGVVPMPARGAKTPLSKIEAGLAANKAKWDDVESRIAYGFAARTHYAKSHADWNDRLEGELRSEWDKANGATPWDDDVRGQVRRGFDAPRTV